MVNVSLIAPSGQAGLVDVGGGTTYAISSTGVVTVDSKYVNPLLAAGFRFYRAAAAKAGFSSPLPADLVSVSAAAIATNRALTIAAQPAHARKLQVRQVIVTGITAGVLTLVGLDQDGQAITEVVSLIAAVSQTLTTSNAFAKLTSATVTGLVGGGDGTLGIGLSNDFGIPGLANAVGVAVVKCTKTTWVGPGTSKTALDDGVAGTFDAAARTYAPTTAPAALGLVDFEITLSGGLAD